MRGIVSTKRKIGMLLCWIALAIAPSVSAFAADSQWWHGELTLGTGVDFSTGDYGEPVDTDLVYVPFSATYLMDDLALTEYPWDQLEFRVTVPFLYIKGPDDFFSGNPAATGTSSASGIGNVILRAGYIWLPLPESWLPVFELRGFLKVPTASESENLGTGAVDVKFELELSKRFGSVSPFAGVGYLFRGDRKSLGLNNFVLTAVGASVKVHDRISLGLSYEWAEASADSRRDSHELVPYMTLRLPYGLTLGPYATFGLRGFTADYGGGFSVRYTRPLRGN